MMDTCKLKGDPKELFENKVCKLTKKENVTYVEHIRYSESDNAYYFDAIGKNAYGVTIQGRKGINPKYPNAYRWQYSGCKIVDKILAHPELVYQIDTKTYYGL